MTKSRVKKKRYPNIPVLCGGLLAKGKRFGIVVSQFNEFLTSRLLEGALDTLIKAGAHERHIHVVYVPGAFEIPLAVKKLISTKKMDAVITLAVVIRGETRHFDQVVREASRGVRELMLKREVPIILGILPTENVGQAMERVGIKQMNKGREWALAAIEMANLMPHLTKKNRVR